jgi:hypothetical protein
MLASTLDIGTGLAVTIMVSVFFISVAISNVKGKKDE